MNGMESVNFWQNSSPSMAHHVRSNLKSVHYQKIIKIKEWNILDADSVLARFEAGRLELGKFEIWSISSAQ